MFALAAVSRIRSFFPHYLYLLFSTHAKSCVSVALYVCVAFFFFFLNLTAVSGFADTAPGSLKRTFWTRVCLPRSSRGEMSREREAPWTCPREHTRPVSSFAVHFAPLNAQNGRVS